MAPLPTIHDRSLARSALEAAVAEARRRRQVVRLTVAAFALLTALGLTVVFFFSQL
jgi:type VI protein secretion system component VasF